MIHFTVYNLVVLCYNFLGGGFMYSDSFGSHLKSIRKHRCITQAEMAKLLHISRQAYSNYEQGRCVPSVTTLIDMSITLNSNLLLCFIPDSNDSIFNHKNIHDSDIPEFESKALLSLYKSLDFNDRLITVESMLIKSCRK